MVGLSQKNTFYFMLEHKASDLKSMSLHIKCPTYLSRRVIEPTILFNKVQTTQKIVFHREESLEFVTWK